jgi:type VI secretion system secreted protein VgrG
MTRNLTSICQLELDAPAVVLTLLHVEAREALGEPARYTVVAEPDALIDMVAFADDAIAQPAKLTWLPESGAPYVVNLVVDQVENLHDGISIELVSRIGTLADTCDHRVFLDMDAVEIIEELLTEHDFVLDVRCERTLEKRAQCVQNFESDLDFVNRLLAEEGIVWHCHRIERDTLVLLDSSSGYDPAEGGALKVQTTGALSDATEGRSVHSTSIHHRTTTDKYGLRDYNFIQPGLDLSAENVAGSGSLERYEYRGRYLATAVGSKLAQLWLEGCRAERRVLRAGTFLPGLSPGQIVELEGGDVYEVEGRWLIIRLECSADDDAPGRGEEPFRMEFQAVPANAVFRMPRPVGVPVNGVQTMKITGPNGEDIQTEEHGRIHAHLRWDRLRPFDETSSTWLRVNQVPNSGGFLLPRIHWETLMGFWEGADDPFVVGRLYNGEAVPPNGLPGDKIVSAFGTLTTPGGGTANLVQFNDTAGNEGMNFNASYDFNEKTEKDKASDIKADETITVGSNHKQIVGQVNSIEVTGSQSYSVGAVRNVSVEANKSIEATNETIMIGGARIFDIGGDQTTQTTTLSRAVGAAKIIAAIEHESVTVTGGMARTYGGSWAEKAGSGVGIGVGGVSKTKVGGAKTVKCKDYGVKAGKLSEKYSSRKEKAADVNTNAKGAIKFDIKGATQMKGADIVFEAEKSIDIKAGGVKIKITTSKITISGKYTVTGDSLDDGGDEKYD